ncbi:acyl-CoA dehydrogenase family protein [Amycolatopsis sp. NBC_01480]|uniref:acyl-CoA dehydrogenase family protein n=1 Tax=Amycolatopsis sp. NBC_01480 TaxID=2903562 RepID=UPI002E2B2665|nr:acyl-CoA dehydrogenase family protein [Amycolatopsis sp. NBC_01480]
MTTVPNSPQEILAAAEAVVPRLRARSAEIEGQRRLPADVAELLRGTGVFRMGFPAEFGGPGLTSAQQVEVVEVLSTGDTAAGWCAMIGMDAGLYALSDAAVREMFPALDVIAAGMLPPMGRADRVPGGYRLTGRWAFASGIAHADWVSSGAFVHAGGERELTASGKPYWRVMMVRPGEVELIDNWHATGLAGSGSVDYTVDDVFVPEEHTFSLGEPTRTGPLAATDALMRKMPAVALGVARAALDHARDVARSKENRMTGRRWAEDYRVQCTIAECEMDLAAVRRGVYRSLEHRWDRMAAGTTLDDLTPDERVDTMLTRLAAMRQARTVVRRLYDLLATTSIYRPGPMDRWLRDLETMCQHVMAQDQIVQSAGAFLLGGTPRFPLALGIVN